MSRLLLLLLTAGVCLVAAGCDEGDSEPLEESNEAYSLELPAGYEAIDEDTRDDVADSVESEAGESLGGEPALDLGFAGAKEREDGFATNINVVTESLPKGMTLEDYEEVSIENAPALGVTLEGDPEPVTLGGEPAFVFEGSVDSPLDQDLHFRTVAAVHEGLAFSLTLTALEDRFDDEAGDLDAARDSWVWRD
jgi:hypothetical protein